MVQYYVVGTLILLLASVRVFFIFISLLLCSWSALLGFLPYDRRTFGDHVQKAPQVGLCGHRFRHLRDQHVFDLLRLA